MSGYKVAVILFTLFLGNVAQALLPTVSPSEDQCSKSAKCVAITQNDTCFGAKLPDTDVSFDFSGHVNIWNVNASLKSDWEWYRNTGPKCWPVLQQLLCAVHFPTCENGTISKVEYKLCKKAHNYCPVVETWSTGQYKNYDL